MNSFLKRSLKKLENVSSRHPLGYFFSLFLLYVGAVFGIILFGKDPFVSPESHVYFDNQLGPATFLQRLFWVAAFDSNANRARPLCTLVDFIDARFIALSFKLGWVHYVSISYFVLGFFGLLLVYRHLRSVWKLDRVFVLLLLGCFITTPVFVLSTCFFHSAKALAAFFSVWISVNCLRELKTGKFVNPWVLGVMGILASLSDEISLFVFLFWLGLMSLASFLKFKILRRTLASLAVTSFLALFLREFVSPKMIVLAQGFKPIVWDNHPIDKFLLGPVQYFSNMLEIWMDEIRWTFGNLPRGIAFVWLPVFLNVVYKKIKSQSHSRPVLILIYASVLVFYICTVLMKIRHPDISAEDLRRFYYWVPFVFLITLSAGALLSLWTNHSKYKGWIALGLLSAILGNLTRLHEHRAIVWNGHLRSYRLTFIEVGKPRLHELLENKALLMSVNPEAEISPTVRSLVRWYQKTSKE